MVDNNFRFYCDCWRLNMYIYDVLSNNCGIRHVTVPIATRILIANVRHIGLSNIWVINLVIIRCKCDVCGIAIKPQ